MKNKQFDSPVLLARFDHTLSLVGISTAWFELLSAECELAVLEDFIGATTKTDTKALLTTVQSVLHGADQLDDVAVRLQGLCDSDMSDKDFRLSAWCEGSGKTAVLTMLLLDVPCDNLLGDLQLLSSRYESILSAAGEGMYGLDTQGRATFANEASTRILGWCHKDILGSPVHDVHHHSHADGSPYHRLHCPIYASLQDGEVHRVDNEVFWKNDGTSVPVEYISTPIIQDGEIQGAVIVFRDISERKNHERQREADYQEILRLKTELEQERDYLRDEISTSTNFGEIIGNSAALQRTMAQISAVADTPSSVLVLGESGVGKEMIARAIHNKSSRVDAPLVKVNCASIPKDLFESEFFGHVKGAFTGAHRDRVGRMQLANGGTLFLDEVGEIPLDLQGKLLRALQEQEFERVGDEATIKVDVRIVAATNKDLMEEVKAKRFREDLYYRLSVFPVSIPPLRDRVDDIAPLATHFINLITKELGREPLSLFGSQVNSLRSHDWPGNIRELKNVIERAVILSNSNKLRLDLAMPETVSAAMAEDSEAGQSPSDFYTEEQFKGLEKANLIKALVFSNWKIAGKNGAAALMGLKPSTLTYRMSNLGIIKPAA